MCSLLWKRWMRRPITPAIVHCYDDHRIAMSFAILGAAAGGITIEDPACVDKTFPTFWDELAALGAARRGGLRS